MKNCCYCGEIINDTAEKCPVCYKEFTDEDMNTMMQKRHEDELKANEKLIKSLNKKENVILGIIGALLGAAIGGVLWLFLARIGFIVGLAGCAIIYCATTIYRLMAGGLSRLGILICVIASIIMIYVANYFSIVLEVFSIVRSRLDISDVMSHMPEFLGQPEVSSVFYKNLTMGYIIAGIASIPIIKKTIDEVDRENYLNRQRLKDIGYGEKE